MVSMGIRDKQKSGMSLRYKRAVFVLLFTAIIDTVFALITHFTIGGAVGEIYLQMVFLPLSAFVSSFFTLLFTRATGLCLICPVISHLLLYGIVLGFSGAMLLWMLLYLFSGFVGLAISYIVLTHKIS